MLKPLFFIVLSGFVMISSCTPGNEPNSACRPAGRYYNRTVLDKCPDASPYQIPSYALELTFEGNDTIVIFNGIEKYGLPFKASTVDCEFTIVGPTHLGDMNFQVEKDSSIMLFDSAWTKVSTPSSFKVAKQKTRSEWSFENFLNECMISGGYRFADSKDTTSRIFFLPNGQVSGLRNFLSYEICYAGDCLEETNPPSQTIWFTNDRGQREVYVMRRADDEKRTYEFYAVGPPLPEIKGNRTVGEVVFRLIPELMVD